MECNSSCLTVEPVCCGLSCGVFIYLLQSTYEAAMLAAGCAVEAVDKVVKDELRHSMALVRYDMQSYCVKYNILCGIMETYLGNC